MKNANPTELQRYLKGMNYPASKEDLLQHAEQHNAPQEIMDVIHQLDEQEYNSPTDITKQTHTAMHAENQY